MSPTSRLTGKAILSSVDHRSTSWGGGRKGTAAYRTCHGAWLTITKRGDITAKGLGIMSVMHETSYNAMRRDFYARFASSTCASLLALARCRYSIFIIRIVRFSCPDFVLIRFKSLSHWRSSLLWEFDEHSWQLTADSYTDVSRHAILLTTQNEIQSYKQTLTNTCDQKHTSRRQSPPRGTR